MYADVMTGSIKAAVEETKRRRDLQQKFNEEHGIVPKTIRKAVSDIIQYMGDNDDTAQDIALNLENEFSGMSKSEIMAILDSLEEQMTRASEDMDFESAARFRDQVVKLKAQIEGTDETRALDNLKAKSRQGSTIGAKRHSKRGKR